jgi:hypothetical protein
MLATLNGEGDMIEMNCASILGNVICLGYTVLMVVLGLHTGNYTFIVASMIGVASVAAVSMMHMYCLHEKEMDEKNRDNAEPFPFYE